MELAPLAADQHLAAVALQVEFLVGAFGKDLAEAVAGQDHAAGRFDREARHLDADAHLQVGAHQDGPVLGDFELDVLQDRLGAARGATLAAIWKACSSLSRSQVAFMD